MTIRCESVAERRNQRGLFRNSELRYRAGARYGERQYRETMAIQTGAQIITPPRPALSQVNLNRQEISSWLVGHCLVCLVCGGSGGCCYQLTGRLSQLRYKTIHFPRLNSEVNFSRQVHLAVGSRAALQCLASHRRAGPEQSRGDP